MGEVSHEATKVFRGDFGRIFVRRCGGAEIFRIGNNPFSFSPFVASCLRVRFFEELGYVVVIEQVPLRHVLSEVILHHAGVDEVFEEAGFKKCRHGWLSVRIVSYSVGVRVMMARRGCRRSGNSASSACFLNSGNFIPVTMFFLGFTKKRVRGFRRDRNGSRGRGWGGGAAGR